MKNQIQNLVIKYLIKIDEKVLNILNSIQNGINELKKKKLELIKKVKMNLKKKEKL